MFLNLNFEVIQIVQCLFDYKKKYTPIYHFFDYKKSFDEKHTEKISVVYKIKQCKENAKIGESTNLI